MYWLIYAGCIIVGFIIGAIVVACSHREKFGKWKSISINVTPKDGELEYHADRYRISLKDNTPYLRIRGIKRYRWVPV